MEYLLGGGEVVAGIILLVLWFGGLKLASTDKPLSHMRFAFWPSLFLLWFVGAMILIFHGLRLV